MENSSKLVCLIFQFNFRLELEVFFLNEHKKAEEKVTFIPKMYKESTKQIGKKYNLLKNQEKKILHIIIFALRRKNLLIDATFLGNYPR